MIGKHVILGSRRLHVSRATSGYQRVCSCVLELPKVTLFLIAHPTKGRVKKEQTRKTKGTSHFMPLLWPNLVIFLVERVIRIQESVEVTISFKRLLSHLSMFEIEKGVHIAYVAKQYHGGATKMSFAEQRKGYKLCASILLSEGYVFSMLPASGLLVKRPITKML